MIDSQVKITSAARKVHFEFLFPQSKKKILLLKVPQPFPTLNSTSLSTNFVSDMILLHSIRDKCKLCYTNFAYSIKNRISYLSCSVGRILKHINAYANYVATTAVCHKGHRQRGRGKNEVLCCIKMAAVATEVELGTGAGCAWLVRYSVTFHYGKDGDCPRGAGNSWEEFGGRDR